MAVLLRFALINKFGILESKNTGDFSEDVCMKQFASYVAIIALMIMLPIDFQASDLLSDWRMLNFDESMRLAEYPKALDMTKKITSIAGDQLYDFFKNLYIDQCSSLPEIGDTPRIPKIFHIIWLGSPVPQELQKIMNSWMKHHVGWHYKIWTDKDLEDFPMHNRELFESSINYGQKADIARFEILYHFGGVYADADTESLRPIDILHYFFDFYIGIQPLDCGMLQLGTGVIGSIPKHPLVKQMILQMHKNAKGRKGATLKTGPVFCTRIFYAFAGKFGLRDVALPATYFYPLDSFKTEIDRDLWLSQGAFTVHHWAKTWMPKEYRKAEFKKIDNSEATKNWNN